MRTQVRREMWRQEPLTMARGRQARTPAPRAAGPRLLATYAGLARRGEHLLDGLLDAQAPRQWRHYPRDDAIDPANGFQWFYHSHSPQDRPGAREHGHIHLFARRKLWARRLGSARELAFAALTDAPVERVNTRHLLGIGFDAKGVATSLFTVNSWVTGDLMLSAPGTLALLERLCLDTGHKEVDAVIECVVQLCQAEIRALLEARDALLLSQRRPGLLRDESLEVLSEVMIDLDRKLALD